MKQSEIERLKPKEVMLGNFIDCMGQVEMITQIVEVGAGSWEIGHKGWGASLNPVPDGVTFDPYPILLTQEWKECLGIDKYEGLPIHIEYVHQAQNWFLFHLQIDLFDTITWHKIPAI